MREWLHDNSGKEKYLSVLAAQVLKWSIPRRKHTVAAKVQTTIGWF